MIFKHENFKNEEDEEIETGSIDPASIEYIESSIKELGKHISELSREEQIS